MKLRVFLPATERPEQGERHAWKLFDARGELRREDAGALDTMPYAKDVEMVLPVERVLFARLKLPKVNAATIRELLPFAVEDRLLADPSQIHAVAGPKNRHGESVVAVVDRQWLRARRDALTQAGHRPTRAVCESALLAGGRGDWHIVWGPGRGLLVDDDGVGASFECGDGLPLTVRVALDEASARGDKPTIVRVHSEGDVPLPPLEAWTTETGTTFATGSRWETLARGHPASGSIDLLQGEFAPRGASGRWSLPRAAIRLGAAILVVHVALSALDAWRMGSERDVLSAQRETIFRAAFPEAKAVVDPELQMARNLEEMKRARGLAQGDDFLAELTRIAREAKAAPRSIEYASGRMVAR